jgi:hypothetical protein
MRAAGDMSPTEEDTKTSSLNRHHDHLVHISRRDEVKLILLTPTAEGITQGAVSPVPHLQSHSLPTEEGKIPNQRD